MTQKNLKSTGLNKNMNGTSSTHLPANGMNNHLGVAASGFQRSTSVNSLANDSRCNMNPTSGYLSPNSNVVYQHNNIHHLPNTHTYPDHLDTITTNRSISSPSNHSDGKTKSFTDKVKRFFHPKKPSLPGNNSEEQQFKSYLGNSISLGRYSGNQVNKAVNSMDNLSDLIVNNPGNLRQVNDNVRIVATTKNKSEKYFLDVKTKNELRSMFNKLPLEDQIQIQEKGFRLMQEEVDRKLAEISQIQFEMEEKKEELNELRTPFKSNIEIEQLKGEIRALTNEKAELEYRISKQSLWTCKKCTFCSNSNVLIKCSMCNMERDESEILMCLQCNTKNSLINRNCSNCNAYFYSVPMPIVDPNGDSNASRRSTNSSNASSSYMSSPLLPNLISSSNSHLNNINNNNTNNTNNYGAFYNQGPNTASHPI